MTEIGRVQFSGKTAFILSAAASAVGLGNIWRFPTIAANDGGGAFLLVYIAITMTFGAVMMITEIASEGGPARPRREHIPDWTNADRFWERSPFWSLF